MEGKNSGRVNFYSNVIATCIYMYWREVTFMLLIIGALYLEDIFKIASFYVIFLSLYRELMRSKYSHQQMGKEANQRLGPDF